MEEAKQGTDTYETFTSLTLTTTNRGFEVTARAMQGSLRLADAREQVLSVQRTRVKTGLFRDFIPDQAALNSLHAVDLSCGALYL